MEIPKMTLVRPVSKSRTSFCLFVFFLIAASTQLNAQTFASIPALSFTKVFGGSDPLPQVLAVASTGSNFNFSASATTSTGGSWLSISPSGTDCCTTPRVVTVTVNPAVSLAAGVYQGQVVFTSYPSASTTLTVPVTLTIASAGPYLDDLPGQLSFSFTPGASSPSQAFQIRNAGTGSLSWTLSSSTADGGNWLTVSASSGTAPSTVTVGVAVQNLPSGGQSPGTFVGQLSIQTATGSATIPVCVFVGDSVFSQVNPISFTMPFGGANPLPQILTIASTAATFNFSASVATANGGNWLQISPSGADCCSAPRVVTVSINASTLPAGSYTGQIVFTQYGSGTMSITVPVTLTISPSTAGFFDNLPGQISFSLPVGGAPSAQVIQVRGTGSGALNWTVAASTADGNSWLSVLPGSGTAPTTVSVAIAPQSLPGGGLTAGTFIGQLLFQSDGGSVATIPVSVVVGPSIFSQVNPISFVMPFAGANPLPQILTIAATGTGFNFSAAEWSATGGNWLQISPSGTDCCSAPRVITVSINASTLPAGTYTGQIVFTQYGSGNMSMTVPVTLTITPTTGTTYFDNLPGQISFSLQTGRTPPTQTVQVRNAGSGTLNWTLTATTADGGDWLVVSPLSAAAPSTVAIAITPQALPGQGLVAGTFIGQLLFQTTGNSVTIPISVVVGDSVFSQVNPISFSMPFGGANPLPQVLAIASTDSTFNFSASASTATGGNWLSISPSGVDCCGTPRIVTVSVNASTLAPGTYTGEVTFAQYGSGTMSMTVPVTLTVSATGATFFDNLPGEISFSLKTGGSAPAQAFQVRNAGSGTLNWTLSASTSDGGAWLSASPLSGTAPSTVTVAIVTQSLPGLGLIPGTFTGQLVFQTAGETVTVPVTVVVGDSVFDQVNPLNFTMVYGGGNPLPQILTIVSTGSAFSFSASATSATGGSWLQVSPSGIGCCSTPRVVTVSISATTLAAGTYTGQIVLTQYGQGTMALTIPVTLTVAEPAASFPDDIPGQLSFSFVPSSSNPPSETVQIRNAGFGVLSWTAADTTSDGGNWLTLSASSGIAPSTVTVGVVSQNLPGLGLIAGNFTGQIVFQTAGGSITVPVSVVIGASIFSQASPLSFTVPSGGNPLSQTLTVSNIGSTFSFSAAAAGGRGGNWLSISPQGVGCCVTPRAITVSVNASVLTSGTFTGEITLTQYGSGTMAMTVPVTVTGKALPATTTVLTSSPNPAMSGQSVTLTATVSPSAATGSVTFVDGATTLGSTTLSGGVAKFVTSNFALGAHALTAVYGGNSVYASSLGTNTLQVTTCASVSQAPLSFDSNGGQIQLALTATSSCSWTAAADSTWIGVAPASGTGNGTVTVTIGHYVGAADQNGNVNISVTGQGSSAVPVTQRFTATIFTDVLPSYYDFDAVNLLSTEGITSGCNASPPEYCPTTNIIRSQMAIFMVRAILHTDAFDYNHTPYFTDVPANAFGFAWIQKMYELGITTGCGPSLYCPNDLVTRAQMAVFLIRMRYGSATIFDFPPTPYFTDVTPSTFGWMWIQRMKEDNITSGCTATTYCPTNSVTRGDMATFVMRGAFNQLLPSTEPILLSISPATIAHGGSPATYTITGLSTNFVDGITTIGAMPGITIGAISVLNSTTLTVQLSASSGATLQPVSPLAITGVPPGNEEAVLPNGLVIQ